MAVRNCLNIPKYTLIGYISLSKGGGERKIILIYNDISLNNTILNLVHLGMCLYHVFLLK